MASQAPIRRVALRSRNEGASHTGFRGRLGKRVSGSPVWETQIDWIPLLERNSFSMLFFSTLFLGIAVVFHLFWPGMETAGLALPAPVCVTGLSGQEFDC